MTDSDVEDALNAALAKLATLMETMRQWTERLSPLPDGGTCEACGTHDDWRYVEQGHVKISHAYWVEPRDTASTNYRYAVEGSLDDFSDIGNTVGYFECAECDAVYRRPDEVLWR